MTTATKFTLARVLLIPVFLVCMYLAEAYGTAMQYVALAVFAIASLTDLIDGKIESGAVDVTLRRSPSADAIFDLTVRGFKAMRSEYGDKLRVVKGD